MSADCCSQSPKPAVEFSEGSMVGCLAPFVRNRGGVSWRAKFELYKEPVSVAPARKPRVAKHEFHTSAYVVKKKSGTRR